MNNYFIIHGSFGNPFVNWIPYLRKELEKENKEVYTPDFPTGVGHQNYTNWSNLLKVYVDSGLINENTIIYAHSIAPIFICKFLVENKIQVKRLIFVCGFNHYLGISEEYDKRHHLLTEKAESARDSIKKTKSEIEKIRDTRLNNEPKDVKDAKVNQLTRRLKRDERLLEHVEKELKEIEDTINVGSEAEIRILEAPNCRRRRTVR